MKLVQPADINASGQQAKAGKWRKGKDDQKPAKGKLSRLKDLPPEVWTEVKQSNSDGLQFFTQCKVGSTKYPVMLDGGSGVNSIPEEILVEILNDHKRGWDIALG